MSKCGSEPKYRECWLVSGGHTTKRWIPDAFSVLGREIPIPEYGGLWKVQSISADFLCQGALRAKAEKYPHLYRALEPHDGPHT